MPILLSLTLALAAQDVTLTSDAVEAPLVCAVALTIVDKDKPPLLAAATFSFFIGKWAAANSAGGPFFDQLSALSSNPPPYPRNITPEMAAALAPQCDKRYPTARSNGPVKLPTDPLARDVVCMFSLSTMGGVARSDATGGPAVTRRYNDAAGRFATRFTATMKTKNLSEDAEMALATTHVISGLDLGNAYVVSEACLKLPQPA